MDFLQNTLCMFPKLKHPNYLKIEVCGVIR
uniref:Uncharacterized protein n=1 Tax=Arundo donax TaxID=35708 RepID=A0A0A9DYZ0_ARUDO